MVCVGAVFHVVFKAGPLGGWTVVIALSSWVLQGLCITIIISSYGHNAMAGREPTSPGSGGPRSDPGAPRPTTGSRAVRRERFAMRYTKDHKQATRRRILDAAGRRLKQDGIDGAGVAAVMSDAGLTNGAFYAHFASKEDLVANVVAHQLQANAKASRPSPRIALDLRLSSAPTCPRSTATSARMAARRPRCSTRSPAAPPPPDRSSPTNCSGSQTTSG